LGELLGEKGPEPGRIGGGSTGEGRGRILPKVEGVERGEVSFN